MKTFLLAQLYNPVLPNNIGAGGPDRGTVVIGSFIGNIIGAMFIIAFFTAFIFLITGGFHWITSGGDKANLEHARNKIIQAIMGLIVTASAWAIMTLVSNFVGWDFPNLPFPTMNQLPSTQQGTPNKYTGEIKQNPPNQKESGTFTR